MLREIYSKTNVKYIEILELFIYEAYIEQKMKEKKEEDLLFFSLFSFYFLEGQKEVNNTLVKKKKYSTFNKDLFLAIMNTPNALGYVYEDYKKSITRYNAEQILRQATINIMQGKELKIDSSEFQNLIDKQQKAKLNINGDKISGAVDNTLIGMNNQAKVQGIIAIDKDAQVKFIAEIDSKTTDMCKSLDGQVFSVKNWNEFIRYSANNQKLIKYRCRGLVVGLNLPPINDNFHYCRSTIIYINTILLSNNSYFEEKNNLIINGFKILDKSLNGINRIALLENINKIQDIKKDFPILNNVNIKYKVINVNDASAMAVQPTKSGEYILEINKKIFNRNIKNIYAQGTKIHQNPNGTTYKDIATHEMGHIVSFEILRKRNKNNINSMLFDYDNEITTNYIVEKAFDNLKVYDIIKKEKLIRNISNYALKNSSETIGEAFADYYCNKKKAEVLSKEIVKVMKGMMKN